MNCEIKIRYTYKRKSDGHIYQVIYPLGCMDDSCKHINGFHEMANNNLWTVVGRDLWTGLSDKNKSELYSNDLFQHDEHKGYALPSFIAKVVWDKDNACFSYVGTSLSFLKKENTKRIFDIRNTFSSHDELQIDVLNHIQIIGNIYEANPSIKSYGKHALKHIIKIN